MLGHNGGRRQDLGPRKKREGRGEVKLLPIDIDRLSFYLLSTVAVREVEEEKRREGWNEVIFVINTGHLSFYLLLRMRERKVEDKWWCERAGGEGEIKGGIPILFLR